MRIKLFVCLLLFFLGGGGGLNKSWGLTPHKHLCHANFTRFIISLKRVKEMRTEPAAPGLHGQHTNHCVRVALFSHFFFSFWYEIAFKVQDLSVIVCVKVEIMHIFNNSEAI